MKTALTVAVFALTLRRSGLTHVTPGSHLFRRPVGLLQSAWYGFHKLANFKQRLLIGLASPHKNRRRIVNDFLYRES